ncbi:MAG: monomethylamine:corrinoid methyltransferase [Spirochaetota bacterium]
MGESFLSVCERSFTGPKLSKEEWDFSYIVMKTRELVESYQLSWDKEDLIPQDDQLLDTLFAAAKKLITETGLFHLGTSRIMQFSADEIEQSLKSMPQSLHMGTGKEAFKLKARTVEDSRPPAIWGGNPGCPTPEKLFAPLVQSVAQEPVVDLITCGSLAQVDGFDVKKSEPSEVRAVVRETQLVKTALQNCGRPGMGSLGAESSISEIGDLAALQQGLLTPSDAHLIALFNELIIDRDNLVRAAASQHTGVKNASLACTMVGGLGGDAPGATLLMAASMMAANIACRADYHLCHPIHINHISTTTRSCLWLQSVLCQCFAKHAPAIIVCDIWPKSGAMTKELLYEVAANAIVSTVSGGHLEGVGTVDGNLPNCSGLEVRLMGEVGKAVAAQGIKRKEANELVLKLLEKYEHVFSSAEGNPGRRFDEVYDLHSITPLPEWERMYEEVKQELQELGLDIT